MRFESDVLQNIRPEVIVVFLFKQMTQRTVGRSLMMLSTKCLVFAIVDHEVAVVIPDLRSVWRSIRFTFSVFM